MSPKLNSGLSNITGSNFPDGVKPTCFVGESGKAYSGYCNSNCSKL